MLSTLKCHLWSWVWGSGACGAVGWCGIRSAPVVSEFWLPSVTKPSHATLRNCPMTHQTGSPPQELRLCGSPHSLTLSAVQGKKCRKYSWFSFQLTWHSCLIMSEVGPLTALPCSGVCWRVKPTGSSGSVARILLVKAFISLHASRRCWHPLVGHLPGTQQDQGHKGGTCLI